MLRRTIAILLFTPQLVFSQTSEVAFQILVAEEAYIFGRVAEPLTYVDDITSIDVKLGGFLALVHKGGTTYELKEKIFTFYLKTEKLKEQSPRPDLAILHSDSTLVDPTETITVLHPVFNEERTLKWEANTPFEIYWHLPDEPVLTYTISISDHTGQKIQDYKTSRNNFTLKPYNFGLQENAFLFQISKTFAGETIASEDYKLVLEEAPDYPIKASDLVLKALNLELSPVNALEVWKEILGMENGKYYYQLFEKFLARNEEKLTNSGEDIALLLSQNK